MATLPKGPTSNILVNMQGMLDPIGFTLRMRERYGDPMSGPKMNGKPVLATGSVEGLRSVFAVPPEALDQMLGESFAAAMGESSLFVLSGARHTAMRKLLMPPFHGQRMRLYGKQICDLALQHSRDLRPGLELVAQDLMHKISLQAIIHVVFGVTAPAEVARLEALLEALRKSFSLGLTITLVLPWLRREFGGFGPWARRQRAIQDLRSFLDPELARRRAEPEGRTDILSLLLEARQEDGTALNDQQIFEQLHTLSPSMTRCVRAAEVSLAAAGAVTGAATGVAGEASAVLGAAPTGRSGSKTGIMTRSPGCTSLRPSLTRRSVAIGPAPCFWIAARASRVRACLMKSCGSWPGSPSNFQSTSSAYQSTPVP